MVVEHNSRTIRDKNYACVSYRSLNSKYLLDLAARRCLHDPKIDIRILLHAHNLLKNMFYVKLHEQTDIEKSSVSLECKDDRIESC